MARLDGRQRVERAAKKKPAPKRQPAPPPKLSPAALSIEDLAGLLSKAGGRKISPAKIREDLAAGAPTNTDGTIHLVHYTAWLCGQVV